MEPSTSEGSSVRDLILVDGLRDRARRAASAATASLYELAAVLGVIHERRSYQRWGHTTFLKYVTTELEVTARTAYQLVDVYRAWRGVWHRFELAPPPWHRLVEAVPLINARTHTAEQLSHEISGPTLTVRRIREIKAAVIPLRALHAPESSPLEGDPEEPRPVDPQTDTVSHYLLVFPGLEVLNRWIGRDGRTWVGLKLHLPDELVQLLSDALVAACTQLRAPSDEHERLLLPALEAICQEALASWR